jgi:hypothetical protein
VDASLPRCVRGFSFMWPSFPYSNALEAGLFSTRALVIDLSKRVRVASLVSITLPWHCGMRQRMPPENTTFNVGRSDFGPPADGIR